MAATEESGAFPFAVVHDGPPREQIKPSSALFRGIPRKAALYRKNPAVRETLVTKVFSSRANAGKSVRSLPEMGREMATSAQPQLSTWPSDTSNDR